MKYVKSISLFFVFPVCAFLAGILFGNRQTEQTQESIEKPASLAEDFIKEEPEEDVMNHDVVVNVYENHEPEEDREGYFLHVREGFVIVYHADEETVFLVTDIPYMELPEAVQTDLEAGIYVSDEGMLYDFLENYTS